MAQIEGAIIVDYQNVLERMPLQDGAFAPCFAFSLHKSGSTMMHAMIGAVCQRAGIPAVSLPDLLFSYGITDKDWAADPTLVPAFSRNLLYYGFRHLPPLLNDPALALRTRGFVLLVRDPRDALVSQYFSFGRKAGSHARPAHNPKALEQHLAQIEDKPIDRYVLEAAPGLLRKLKAYRDTLDFSRGLLRRYEDVYFDKETFLTEIFAHLAINVPRSVLAEVAQTYDVRPDREDDTKHIRKGTPGDHVEKLQPATIAELNDRFRDMAAFYGYAL